ncbi:DNA repair protein RecN [Janibacter sp. G56]|uniref:DNA repair protein RecN n=1 Tax=Janibacter sp. G56 TaxID=3418717 RepID=UPI003CFBD895
MIQEIRIQGLGVIEDATLELHPGLNVVTGETGAGKTMVVSGLGLLLGSRSDAGLVRTGSERAVVEGFIDVPADHPAAERVREAGADADSGIVLVRTVSGTGRSRAHAGGRSVPVGLLAELAEDLVAVHGQADQWRLRRPEEHRAVLDGFGGDELAAALDDHARAYDALKEARATLASLRQQDRDRAQDIETLQFQLAQIEQVDPQPGEELALRVEDERLSHAEELRMAAERARAHLGGDESQPDMPAVVDAIAAARDALATAATADPELADLEKRAVEVGVLAGELAGDLASYAAGVELDPARLAWVQQRRADLGALLRKYGETSEEVIAWSGAAAARLDDLLGADDRLAALEASLADLTRACATTADRLTSLRQAAAAGLSTRVTEELAHLAMGKAAVTVAVTQREVEEGAGVTVADGRHVALGRQGVDDVEILLAANPGTPPRSVVRAASGGELSRVMLAIEVALGAASTVPTYVFDEVDAGVGGKAAVDVGARLAALADRSQVIVVTHLAQVAAFADRHLVVHKTTDGQVTASDVRHLAEDERAAELARMMGSDPSGTALEHAQELLDESARIRTAAVR